MNIKDKIKFVFNTLYTFHQGSRSYIYPVIKVICSVVMYIIIWNRHDIFPFVYRIGLHPVFKVILLYVMVSLMIIPFSLAGAVFF